MIWIHVMFSMSECCNELSLLQRFEAPALTATHRSLSCYESEGCWMPTFCRGRSSSCPRFPLADRTGRKAADTSTSGKGSLNSVHSCTFSCLSFSHTASAAFSKPVLLFFKQVKSLYSPAVVENMSIHTHGCSLCFYAFAFHLYDLYETQHQS